MSRDLSPIDQLWIRDYCDEFLKVATRLPSGALRDVVLRRIECVHDLVEAWQKRNTPMDKR